MAEQSEFSADRVVLHLPVANGVDTHIGNKVRQRRLALGMNQEVLASALGVTFQQVQKYERGLNRLSASRLFELTRVLGVPIKYFYDGLHEPRSEKLPSWHDAPPIDASAFLGTQEGAELIACYLAIDDVASRRVVMTVMRALAAKST